MKRLTATTICILAYAALPHIAHAQMEAQWTVPDPVRTTQWALTNPDTIDLGPYELPAFPPRDISLGGSNGFFDVSQYAADCGTGLLFYNRPAAPTYGPLGMPGPPRPAVQRRLCKATAAPVVDSGFLN